jgi:hypothetical protein
VSLLMAQGVSSMPTEKYALWVPKNLCASVEDCDTAWFLRRKKEVRPYFFARRSPRGGAGKGREMKAKAKSAVAEAGGLIEAGGGKRRQARFREKKNMGKQGTKGRVDRACPAHQTRHTPSAPHIKGAVFIFCACPVKSQGSISSGAIQQGASPRAAARSGPSRLAARQAHYTRPPLSESEGASPP